jgi:quercetin dioxygenase-like cupin family protein
MDMEKAFRKIEKVAETGIGSCDVLYIKPGAIVPKHFHKMGIEVEYVYKGSCRTHKEGKVYVWKKGEPHGVVNDSNEELILVCLRIPPHSEEDMNYV